MRLGVIGCGLIGMKRASSLPEGSKLVGCFDISEQAANIFADKFGVKAFTNINELLDIAEIDAVIVATRHDALAEISLKALKAGIHVFIEKPGAINFNELLKVKEIAQERKLVVHIGYNHRHHGSFQKAHSLVSEGQIGDLMFVRGRYGHGGRLGYETEWRADKSKSGGGELIDQGSHLIDLAISFLGPMKLAYSAIPTYFWKMDLEDNAFISLESDSGKIAFLHASCTEWKNLFSFEIYGKTGKIDISGLGRSYGLETLTFYKMSAEMGPPISETWTYPEPDHSWGIEIKHFFADISKGSCSSKSLDSALHVLKLIQEIYEIK